MRDSVFVTGFIQVINSSLLASCATAMEFDESSSIVSRGAAQWVDTSPNGRRMILPSDEMSGVLDGRMITVSEAVSSILPILLLGVGEAVDGRARCQSWRMDTCLMSPVATAFIAVPLFILDHSLKGEAGLDVERRKEGSFMLAPRGSKVVILKD